MNPTKVLPLSISQFTAWTPATGLNPKLNRGKFLTDRRVKVQAISVPKAALVVEFNFEDYIREDVGVLPTLAEIGRVLNQVEASVREEVQPSFEMKTAELAKISFFKNVTAPAETSRCMKLLYLLSRDRGGQDLAEEVLVDPGVPRWFGDYVVMFDKAWGRLSKNPAIKKAAIELRSDQIRFEARNTFEVGKEFNRTHVADLLSKPMRFLHDYAESMKFPFDRNLHQIKPIEMNRSREERAELERNNRDYYDQKAFRPFRDQTNIDLIAELKTRLYDFSTATPKP